MCVPMWLGITNTSSFAPTPSPISKKGGTRPMSATDESV
jgi:hypothetical protein